MGVDVSLGGRRYRDALKALKSLTGAGYQARLAGGAVRDRLLGAEPQDFDVATSAKPPEVMGHFRAVGWRTVPTGLEHGTVTLVMGSGPVEITTLRVDVATDGRHADVAFGTSFEEDAARRDFTVNAMFEDENGVVYDYHGGQADLAARTLRFVGDPTARIREDYLRILRLFRFWAKLGFSPAPGVLEATREERSGLARVSQERISSELLKILTGEHADAAVRGMVDAQVWESVLPEAKGLSQAAALSDARFWEELAKAPHDKRAVVALGALTLAAGGLDAAGWTRLAARLRLSAAEGRTLAFMPVLLAHLATPCADAAAAFELIDQAEREAGEGAWTSVYSPYLRAAKSGGRASAAVIANFDDVTRVEELHGARRRAKPPLDGRRVMSELKLEQGPELGATMDALKRAYRNGDITTADDAVAWLTKRR